LNLLGHALRKAVGLAARELSGSAEAILEEAGLVLVGHGSLMAALDRDWGQQQAREQVLGLVLAEVERWETWLAQHQRLLAESERVFPKCGDPSLPQSRPSVRRGLGRAHEHGRERISGPVLGSQRRGVRSRLTETPRDCASPRVS
jgi:hypothetical protein